MPVYPIKKEEIIALSRKVMEGFKANSDIFSTLPFPITEMQKTITDIDVASVSRETHSAAASKAVIKEKELLAKLSIQLRKYINYAEDTLGKKSEQLKLIGWGTRKARTPLKPPGKVLDFEHRSGPGWVFLSWKHPKDGGKVSGYEVQVREYPAAVWKEHDVIFETEIAISDLTRGKTFEYRIISANKAGTGPPSNIVSVEV